MWKFAALCAALLLPGPVLAQGAPAPTAAQVRSLESCVENYARSSPASRVIGGCVGIFGATCRDQTTLGISECIQTETAAWDILLNRWWKPMKANAQAAGTWDSLLSRQRRWIKDKDAACQRAYDSAGGGSIRVIYAAECYRDWTADKAVEFYYTLYK